MKSPPSRLVFEERVAGELRRDLGDAGDLTTDSIVPADLAAGGTLVARRAGRVCGLEPALAAFSLLDPAVEVEIVHGDGSDVDAGTVIVTLAGKARALLSAERTALNLLGRLSGIATATRDLVGAVAGHGARIVCTRKTTLGLRDLEKYAVRVGGGVNHRFGLYDAVLIKDNHRVIAGGVAPAIRRARERLGHLVKLEVEVDSLAQLEEALAEGVDAVLLDNMSLVDLERAVARVAGRAVTEASGGITPETAAAVAATGVDLISVGWLTHSAPAWDVALDLWGHNT